MAAVQITPVDPADREAPLAWNALLRDGFNAGREAAWWADGESVLAQHQDPKPGRTSVFARRAPRRHPRRRGRGRGRSRGPR
ncbi:hypothetical protein [Brachybacterium sp. GPGPB12]|uniref:hypothetical protein n=1 Tax=Brachybacterium sp. GPGPB12 TaxID=3023517 RepID=UPI0031344D20